MVSIPKVAETVSQVVNIIGLCLYLYIFRKDVLLAFYVEVAVIRWASYENKLHQLKMFDMQQSYPPMVSKDHWIPYWLSVREQTYAELGRSFEKDHLVPNLLFDKMEQAFMENTWDGGKGE